MAILGWNLECEGCEYKEFHRELPPGYNLRNCPMCGHKLISTAEYIFFDSTREKKVGLIHQAPTNRR